MSNGKLTFMWPVNNQPITIDIVKIQEDAATGFMVAGNITSGGQGHAAFIIKNNIKAGYIIKDGGHYQIIPIKQNCEAFVQKTISGVKSCGEGGTGGEAFEGDPDPPTDQCEYVPTYETCPASVKVLMIVSPEGYNEIVNNNSWGVFGAELYLRMGVAFFNLSLWNSDVPNKEIYAVLDTSTIFQYTTTGTPLSRLLADRDNLKPTYEALRVQYGADLVAFITDERYGPFGGAAYVSSQPIDPDQAYSIVCVPAFHSYGAFMHEIAHLFGCRHDWPNDGEPVCAHGKLAIYQGLGGSWTAWTTIMAYPPATPGGVITYIYDENLPPVQVPYIGYVNHFSNPQVYIGTEPTGNSTGYISDNAQQLRDWGCVVADFAESNDLNIIVSGTNGCAQSYTFNCNILPPSSGEGPGQPPYTYTWEYNDTGVFNWPNSNNIQFGNTPTATLNAPPFCPEFYVRCRVQGSNNFIVSQIYKVTVPQQCPSCPQFGGGGDDRAYLLASDTEPGLNIFPNPGNGRFTITSDKGISSAILTDQIGHQIADITPDTQLSGISTWNNALPTGLYFVKVLTTDGFIQTLKLIVL